MILKSVAIVVKVTIPGSDDGGEGGLLKMGDWVGRKEVGD
jgi:hypothetical protein